MIGTWIVRSALWLLAAGNADDLREHLNQHVSKLRPDDVEGRFQLALWAESVGLQTESKRLLRSTLKIDPRNVRIPWMLFGRTANFRGIDWSPWPVFAPFGDHARHAISLAVQTVARDQSFTLTAVGTSGTPVLLLVGTRCLPNQSVAPSPGELPPSLLLVPVATRMLASRPGHTEFPLRMPPAQGRGFTGDLYLQIVECSTSGTRTSNGIVCLQHP